jgi:hypothetical protein
MSDGLGLDKAARAEAKASAKNLQPAPLDPEWPYRVERFDHSLVNPATPKPEN